MIATGVTCLPDTETYIQYAAFDTECVPFLGKKCKRQTMPFYCVRVCHE